MIAGNLDEGYDPLYDNDELEEINDIEETNAEINAEFRREFAERWL